MKQQFHFFVLDFFKNSVHRSVVRSPRRDTQTKKFRMARLHKQYSIECHDCTNNKVLNVAIAQTKF